jgi:hypothetical protein
LYLPGTTGASNYIDAFVLFIEFPDDDDTTSVTWPRNAAPSGPSPMASDIIDAVPSQNSGKKYNITTYFHDQSFGKLTIIGHRYWKMTRYSLQQYRHPISVVDAGAANHPEDAGQDFSGNVRYWATRHAIEDLDASVDFAPFDRWIYNGEWNHAPGADSYVDLFIALWRSDGSFKTTEPERDAEGNPKTDQQGNIIYKRERDKSFEGFEGVANLGFIDPSPLPPVVDVDRIGGVPQRHIAMYTYTMPGIGAPGSGVTILNAKAYPLDFDVPVHEIGHKLGLDHQYQAGMWTLMGNRTSNVCNLMSAFEREYMGWITVPQPTVDEGTVTLRDFATTGDAYKYMVPGIGFFYFENHQGLASSYVTSLPGPEYPLRNPNDNYSYDVPDKTPGQANGLYIVQQYASTLSPVCADGTWHWTQVACPNGVMAAPWDQNQSIPIAQRGAIDLVTGKSDREYDGPWTACDGSSTFHQPMVAYVDPQTDVVRVSDPFKKFGDGKDRWTLDGANMFSPWSNPSSRKMDQVSAPTSLGAEIVGQSGTSVDVKFYLSNPQDGPPAKPQSFRVDPYSTVWLGGPPSNVAVSQFKTSWAFNVEPDIAGYQIYFRPDGVSSWSFFNYTTNNEFIWQIPDPWSVNTSTVCHFKVRAVDVQGLKSVFSDEDTISLNYGGTLKPALPMSDDRLRDAVFAEPNPAVSSVTIYYQLPADGDATVMLFDLLGNPIAKISQGEQAKGEQSVAFSVTGLAQGLYRYVVTQNDYTVSGSFAIVR